MYEDSKSCCCPQLVDIAGAYTHDTGTLPGQFKKTLTLTADGTFEYFANFDQGMLTSQGTWKVIPQGAKCWVELSSDPKPENPLINVHFDRTLLHVNGSCLVTEPGPSSMSFCRMASGFPKKA